MEAAKQDFHLSREYLLKIGYIASEVDMTYHDFKEMLRDWKIKPVGVNGVLVGMFANKGSRVHFSILEHHRKKWLSKKVMKELLVPILDAYGFLTTAVSDKKPHGNIIAKKAGCEAIGRVGTNTIYKLERLKWV